MLGLAWYGGLLLFSTRGNEWFIQWAFRWGVVVSMGLAFLTGWAAFWVGCRLVSPQHRLGAGVVVVLILVPLLALLGVNGLIEMHTSLADPDYYRRNGVGPVNMVAYLAQSAGLLLGFLHDRRQSSSKLSWIDNDDQGIR